VLTGALAESAARHDDWIVARHEDLLVAPSEQLAALCERAGLEYSDASAAYVEQSNQPGEGYKTHRVAKDLSEKWRQVLSQEDADEAIEIWRAFPPHLGLLARAGDA
jgi:hypothetical protein